MVFAASNRLDNALTFSERPENKGEDIQDDLWEIHARIRGSKDEPGWGDLAEDEAAFIKSQAIAENKKQKAAKKSSSTCKGMWFVKEPKPFVDETEAKRLQQQFELQLMKVKQIGELVKMKKKEKAEACDNTAAAQRLCHEAQNLVKTRIQELKSWQQSSQDPNAGHIAQVGTQPAIREAGELVDKELRMMKKQEASSKQVLKKLRSAEKLIDQDLKKLKKEQSLETSVKSSMHASLQAARKDKRDQLAAFKANRKFSRMIRDMVKEGRADEAEAACARQTEEMLLKMTDPAYRKQYLENCRNQHSTSKKLGDRVRDINQADEPCKDERKKLPENIVVNSGQDVSQAVLRKSFTEKIPELEPEKTDRRIPTQLTLRDEPRMASQLLIPDTPTLAKPENKPNQDDDFGLPSAALQKVEKMIATKKISRKATEQKKRSRCMEETMQCSQKVTKYDSESTSANESSENEDVLQKFEEVRRIRAIRPAALDTPVNTYSSDQSVSYTKEIPFLFSDNAKVRYWGHTTKSPMKPLGQKSQVENSFAVMGLVVVLLFTMVWGILCQFESGVLPRVST